MPYEMRPTSKRRATRRARFELFKTVKPYIINPLRVYEYETEMLLRFLARWLHKRGYAPTINDLSKAHKLRPVPTKKYLLDLEASGLVLPTGERGWMPTPAGFAAVNIAPCEPVYPTNYRAREALKWQAREFERMRPRLEPILTREQA